MTRFIQHLSGALILSTGFPSAFGMEPLTTVGAVRALSRAEMSEGREVVLTGVATYVRSIESDFNFSLHDSTGGAMIYPAERKPVVPGQQVTVRGITASSVHGLRVDRATVEPGPMGPLPEPLGTTMAEVREGRHEGDFAEMEGVLRAVRLEAPEVKPQRLALDFGSRSRRLTVWLSDHPGGPAQYEPGATLRVRGVVMRWRNPRGQTQNINVLTNSGADVRVVGAAPAPVDFRIAEAQLWTGPDEPARPMRFAGTVTAVSRDRSWAVLQEEAHAIRVRFAEGLPGEIELGEWLQVSGFPSLGEYTVELEDAHELGRGQGEAVTPEVFADAAAVLAGTGLVDRDARLIEVPGTVNGMKERDDGLRVLELSSGGVTFVATLPQTSALPAGIREGSLVRLTGICELRLTEERRRIAKLPDLFQLRLRDARDLVVLRPGPWWTPPRLQAAALGASAGLLLLAAWSATLRRANGRLRQEVAGRERAERELSNERRRVAAELHDTLEQTLMAASLQLNAASRTLSAQPAVAAQQMHVANQLVGRSRQEVRDAVWDLRLEERAAMPLGPVLQRLCDESTGDRVEIRFQLYGEDLACPCHIAAQVSRLAREALANALKHAGAQTVTMTLVIQPDEWILTVVDDGHGFVPRSAPGPESGHFGLAGMEERVQRLGGRFEVKSEPGGGCSVWLEIPFSNR